MNLANKSHSLSLLYSAVPQAILPHKMPKNEDADLIRANIAVKISVHR